MKKITLIMFALLGPMVFGQMTYDLDWEIGVNGAAASFTIETGDTMRWTWTDALPHSVTNQAGSQENFDSGILKTVVPGRRKGPLLNQNQHH